MRVLVSSEEDDEVGVSMLNCLDDVEVALYDPNDPVIPPDVAQSAHVLIPPYRSSRRPIQLLSQLPNLRMVQCLSAGADEWAPHVPDGVVLSTATGAHAGPVSEWVVSAILCLYRQWPALESYRRQQVWAHRRVVANTLDSARILIIGAGAIGSKVAERVEIFGAEPVLVASRARGRIHGPDDIPWLLCDVDVVVITAPLTHDTHGMVNAAFLAALPHGAVVVNAGRGSIIETSALVAELKSGRLRAALDVTDPEPLPAGHPLWQAPGVIISPHMARTVPGTNELCYQIAVARIREYQTTPPTRLGSCPTSEH